MTIEEKRALLKPLPDYADKANGVFMFNDHFQNFSRYQIPKAQLIIADPPL